MKYFFKFLRIEAISKYQVRSLIHAGHIGFSHFPEKSFKHENWQLLLIRKIISSKFLQH